ncbi:TIGR00730 family Rossman fold protein [Streptomyces sp. NPDC051322]|uniref:LOG family protein n=1 Tax=Streptomyces sp. NPDC051322 TaxID=3154645 RepID=UPI0034506AB1
MQTLVKKSERIAVFCGARPGNRPDHMQAGRSFGLALARRGLDLVYGAGGVGVMGAVADGVLEAGGSVTGVIPRSLHERERADRARGAIFVVRSMHERKTVMYRLSSGFAVLPGGFGTLDELMEVATWNQLSLMDKPIVVVNLGGFFDPMLAMLDHLVAEGFLSAKDRRLIQAADTVQEALDRLAPAEPGHADPAHANRAVSLIRSSA